MTKFNVGLENMMKIFIVVTDFPQPAIYKDTVVEPQTRIELQEYIPINILAPTHEKYM